MYRWTDRITKFLDERGFKIGRLAGHVWSYDFVHHAAADGRPLKLLTLIDESTRECLAIGVGRCLRSLEVIEVLSDAMLFHGIPEHIRSDNGPEMTSKRVRNWLQQMGTQTLFIEPRSPWENGYNESFNGKPRHQCLNKEIFYSLKKAQIIIEQWRIHYNIQRPHSALGYRPPRPVPRAIKPTPTHQMTIIQ